MGFLDYRVMIGKRACAAAQEFFGPRWKEIICMMIGGIILVIVLRGVLSDESWLDHVTTGVIGLGIAAGIYVSLIVFYFFYMHHTVYNEQADEIERLTPVADAEAALDAVMALADEGAELLERAGGVESEWMAKIKRTLIQHVPQGRSEFSRMRSLLAIHASRNPDRNSAGFNHIEYDIERMRIVLGKLRDIQGRFESMLQLHAMPGWRSRSD